MCTGTLTGNTSEDTLKTTLSTTLSSSQIIDKLIRPHQNIERTYSSLDQKQNLSTMTQSIRANSWTRRMTNTLTRQTKTICILKLTLSRFNIGIGIYDNNKSKKNFDYYQYAVRQSSQTFQIETVSTSYKRRIRQSYQKTLIYKNSTKTATHRWLNRHTQEHYKPTAKHLLYKNYAKKHPLCHRPKFSCNKQAVPQTSRTHGNCEAATYYKIRISRTFCSIRNIIYSQLQRMTTPKGLSRHTQDCPKTTVIYLLCKPGIVIYLNVQDKTTFEYFSNESKSKNEPKNYEKAMKQADHPDKIRRLKQKIGKKQHNDKLLQTNVRQIKMRNAANGQYSLSRRVKMTKRTTLHMYKLKNGQSLALTKLKDNFPLLTTKPYLTKMPNAGEANKAKRPQPEETQAGQPNKKTCDPKGDAAAPKAKETTLGKKPTKQVGPTEAQVRHAEIVKKARADQAAQASLAAQAKAAKSPVAGGLVTSMPILSPAEVLLNQLAGPVPVPIEPIQDIQPGPDDATDDDIEITGQRALTPDPDRPTQALNLPHLTKEQKASAIDLNFAWVLLDDPRKALQIARNTSKINQALKAICELKKVSTKNKPKAYSNNKKT